MIRSINPNLLTTSEAADALRVSRATIHRAIDRREIEIVRIGKLIRVRRESIARLLTARS